MGLKEYREKKKMTQKEVTQKIEMNPRTYQYIEKRNNTDIFTAKKISKILGAKTIEEVFFYEEKEKHYEK